MMVIDSAKREDQLQNHPQQAETFESIGALIREVRQCQEAAQYRIVQQKLGQHVEHADNMAEEANIRLKRIEKQLDQFPYHKDVGDKKPEREILEREREAAEFERDLYRRIGSQYRSVGDAMAWQLYSFQALPIYALGLNPSPGPISNSKKQGADRETEKVDEYWGTKRLHFVMTIPTCYGYGTSLFSTPMILRHILRRSRCRVERLHLSKRE